MDNPPLSDPPYYPLKEALVLLNDSLQLGEHIIIDLSDCDPDLLLNSEGSRDFFFKSVKDAGLTIISEGFYRFSPHGFTCFLLLAESHASLHAWPEYNYCAIDLFTCNLQMDLQPLVDILQAHFRAGHISIRNLSRMAQVEMDMVLHA